jgi:hypothetical protein
MVALPQLYCILLWFASYFTSKNIFLQRKAPNLFLQRKMLSIFLFSIFCKAKKKGASPNIFLCKNVQHHIFASNTFLQSTKCIFCSQHFCTANPCRYAQLIFDPWWLCHNRVECVA